MGAYARHHRFHTRATTRYRYHFGPALKQVLVLTYLNELSLTLNLNDIHAYTLAITTRYIAIGYVCGMYSL